MRSFVVAKLGTRMQCKHFPNQQQSIIVRNLPAVIGALRQPVSAIYVNRRGWPGEWTKKSAFHD